jgi:hypothetical protein
VACSYFAISFILLNWSDFHPVYASMYYCLHLFFVGTLPLLTMLKPKRAKRDKKE